MAPVPLVRVYCQYERGQRWLERYRGKRPVLGGVLGFTDTGLIPGISAAGATPADRQTTAIADAEFLANGAQPHPRYPLPPLHVGASPVLISRAVVEQCQLPLTLFNAGLPKPPAVPAIELYGCPARCLSTGHALNPATVQELFQRGLYWGDRLAAEAGLGYVILAECVVGGTTTALAVLTGLGIPALGKVNSSHPVCNHEQKWVLVNTGLHEFRLQQPEFNRYDPLASVAAVGDPMQVAVAGMAIAASRRCGVMLAGGTQMLAVYALLTAIAKFHQLPWQPEEVIVGTTRWVAEDPTGDTIGLAEQIGGVALLATQLSFAKSQFSQLRAYEQGYVKEGVGAGGCAIAASLYRNWDQPMMLAAVDAIARQHQYYQR